MIGFQILDNLGNIISNLSFGSLYVLTNSNDQMIQIRSELYELVNVTIEAVPLPDSLIPPGLQKTSYNSYKYVKLSLDQLNFPDILNIESIPAGTNQQIFVQCQIPDYADAGNFMCGIKVHCETP